MLENLIIIKVKMNNIDENQRMNTQVDEEQVRESLLFATADCGTHASAPPPNDDLEKQAKHNTVNITSTMDNIIVGSDEDFVTSRSEIEMKDSVAPKIREFEGLTDSSYVQIFN